MNEFRAAAIIAVGSMFVAVISLWYSTGVGDAAINLWRQL